MSAVVGETGLLNRWNCLTHCHSYQSQVNVVLSVWISKLLTWIWTGSASILSRGSICRLKFRNAHCPVPNALAEEICKDGLATLRMYNIATYSLSYGALQLCLMAVFKGRQVLIPDSMQAEILHQMLFGHQGIEKTKLLAQDSCQE